MSQARKNYTMHCMNPRPYPRFQPQFIIPKIHYFGPKILTPRHHHPLSHNYPRHLKPRYLLPHTGNFSHKRFGPVDYGNCVVKKIKHEFGRHSYVMTTLGEADPNRLELSEPNKNEHLNYNMAQENYRPPSTKVVDMSHRVEYHGQKHLEREYDDSQQKTVQVSIESIKKKLLALRTDPRVQRAIQRAKEDMEMEEMAQISKANTVTNKGSQSGYLKEGTGSQIDLNMISEQKKRKSRSKGVLKENDDKTPVEIQIPPLKINESKRYKTRQNLFKQNMGNQEISKKKNSNALKAQQENVDSHFVRPIIKIGLNENKQAKKNTAKVVDVILEELDKLEIRESQGHFEETLSERYEEAVAEASGKTEKDILDQDREIPNKFKETVLEENSAIFQNQVDNESKDIEIMSIKSKDEGNITHEEIIEAECIDDKEEDIEEHTKEHHNETFDHHEIRIDVEEEAKKPIEEGFEQKDCYEAILECDEVLELREKEIKEKEGFKLCNKNKPSIESLKKLQKISGDKVDIKDETKEKENTGKSENKKATTIILVSKWNTTSRRRKNTWQLEKDGVADTAEEEGKHTEAGESLFNPNYITEMPHLVPKNSCGQRKRILKLIWDPTSVKEKKLRKYFKKLEKVLGCNVNQEKAIKLLQDNDNKRKKVWKIIEGNERAYSKILGVNARRGSISYTIYK